MQPKAMFKEYFFFFVLVTITLHTQAQKNLPTDYLPKEFHRGRRDAARELMPANSVMVVFAAPTRTFSNDMEYVYHQNPDLYYFTGYKEPNSVFFLFKEDQKGADGQAYHELLFVQRRDEQGEQWTGRRLGVKGVQERLGIAQALEGKEFHSFPLEFSKFATILFSLPEGVVDIQNDSSDLYDLVGAFKKKVNLTPSFSDGLEEDFLQFRQYATANNLSRMQNYFSRQLSSETYKSNPIVKELVELKDPAGIAAIKAKMKAFVEGQKFSPSLYKEITGRLREIKTPEEMVLLRRAVEISCRGHMEAIKAIKPDMSERELQGIQEYVHKKYGAEEVGYNSIVGAGDNGCVLHYMENASTAVGTDMLVMDVGAEYHGYTADVTRSIPSDGKFSPEERALYQLVYNAQEAAFKVLKEGTPWADADKAAREVISDGLLKLGIIKKKEDNRLYYPHGLSHHIGLDVHDRGFSDTLRKGMVITIEPGIYIPTGSACDKKWWGIGIRIEDDALIRENDYELLSALAPRSIEALEKMMAEKSTLNDFVLPPLQAEKKAF